MFFLCLCATFPLTLRNQEHSLRVSKTNKFFLTSISMRYVDVILPVPLDGTFTYTIDTDKASRCAVGMRVLVPFGPTKTYAGVVTRLHDDAPSLPASSRACWRLWMTRLSCWPHSCACGNG